MNLGFWDFTVFGFRILGFRAWGSGFYCLGLGFRIWGFGLGVHGLGDSGK